MLFEAARFEDPRGSFAVTFQADVAQAAGLTRSFVQDNRSLSRPVGTVRGLHLQLPPWEQGKLVEVLRGRIVDVFVDLRPGSATQGHHGSVELCGDDARHLWVPPGFAHGFCTLEPDTEVAYKVDAPYRPEAEWTLAWDDPTLAIDWPVDRDRAVLSDKDGDGHPLAETVAAIAAARDGVTAQEGVAARDGVRESAGAEPGR
jgi:dTDP-4-dehydrorhamnose 3,5-epimerase